MPRVQVSIDSKIFFPKDALTNDQILGESVLILGGGGIGCEVAEFLAERGKEVRLIEEQKRVGADMEPLTGSLLYRRLKELSVEFLLEYTVKRIENNKVICEGSNGNQRTVQASSVICALGFRPNDGFIDIIKKLDFHIEMVGDCLKPGKIADAIRAGFLVSSKI